MAALVGVLACSGGSKSETPSRSADPTPSTNAADEGNAVDGGSGSDLPGVLGGDEGGAADGVATPGEGVQVIDEPAAPDDETAEPTTAYVVPGDSCESNADCTFDPNEARYGPIGVCESTGCGEPTCHDFVPCAAPSEPIMVCSCDGEVVLGSKGCDRISNYAFSLDRPSADTTYVGGCAEQAPEQWLVRLEVTGWDEYEGAELTIFANDGTQLVSTVTDGAISMLVGPQTGYGLSLFFDSNDDGECNDGEVSFDTLNTVNATIGEVVVSPAAEAAPCE